LVETAGRGALGSAVVAGTRVLLVEDDEGDAFLVREMLLDAASTIELVRARSLREALDHVDHVQCVLLDLGLPDAEGIDGVSRLIDRAPDLAVLVLTGVDDEHRGTQAVAAGAQDYLVKGQVDGALLSRAIRYAMERKRADESLRRLYESDLRAAENTRLERGLLPTPLVQEGNVGVVTRYRPGRHQAQLGGDFYDLVERPDGSLYALIGDVSGHGPDEAALGVALRIAWRTLVLGDREADKILPTVEKVLVSERSSDEVFATLCMVRVSPNRRSARVWLAGHPSPVLIGPEHAHPLRDVGGGPALGVVDDGAWRPTDTDLDPHEWLLLYTDGLIEGRVHGGPDRLGEDGLLALAKDLRARGLEPQLLVDGLIDEARSLNAGELTDDVAVLLLSWTPGGGA
jgi:serine phosphatase RsbU (regulator of sigma subunit)